MKYFIRSLKYFVALCVICVAILALMLATGTSALTLDQTVYVMFHTSRYATLFAAIVVLAALYPKFGFVVRKVEGDVEENREQIINAFKSAGFSLRGEEDTDHRHRGRERPRPDRLYAAGLFPVANDPEHRPVRGPGCRDAPPGSTSGRGADR